jgi:hypothetical protein
MYHYGAEHNMKPEDVVFGLEYELEFELNMAAVDEMQPSRQTGLVTRTT